MRLLGKRLLAAALGLMVVGLPFVARADGRPVGLYLDGHQVVTDVPPAIVDGRTLVPLRSIAEALGGTVNWDPATSTVAIQRRGHHISLQLNSQQAIVDDKPVSLDVPAQIIDSRTVVPVRFIVEAFGGEVDWDAVQGAVILAVDNEAMKEQLRVDKANRMLPGDPPQYTHRATEAGLHLAEPSRGRFASDGAVRISGHLGKTLANATLLVKVSHTGAQRETGLQAHDGTFSGTVYLVDGAGQYDISILTPESLGSMWFYEATTLQVEDVNPLPQFGPYYTSGFFPTGLQFNLPTNGQIAVDTFLPLAGSAPSALEGRYLWVQAEKGDARWDTYVPIQGGKFSGNVYLGGGPGIYWAKVLLQNSTGTYYDEIASIPVVNTNPATRVRPVALQPMGFQAGLTVDPLPERTETGGLQLSGAVDPKYNGQLVWFVEKNGDRQDDQLYLPVENGRFHGTIPLTLGPGDYEVTVRVPESPNWYRDAATLRIRSDATQVFQGFHYYLAAIQHGVRVEQPTGEQSSARSRFTLAGTIEHYDTSRPYLIAETRLDKVRANYRLPIVNGRFQGDVWLRFGQGQYEVTLYYPKTTTELTGLVRLQVTGTDTTDRRDLAPSMGIETEDSGIVALAQKLTDGKNPRDAAHAVFEWVAQNVSYDYDKAAFWRVDPDEGAVRTLRTRTGVCRDYAALTVALLRAAKIPAHDVVGDAWTGFTRQSHAWVEALLDGKWVQMDPTFASGVIQGTTFVPRYDPRYFDPPADWFGQDHFPEGVQY